VCFFLCLDQPSKFLRIISHLQPDFQGLQESQASSVTAQSLLHMVIWDVDVNHLFCKVTSISALSFTPVITAISLLHLLLLLLLLLLLQAFFLFRLFLPNSYSYGYV
jgi:hypothetical protein